MSYTQAKVSKQSVDYRHSTGIERQCQNCAMSHFPRTIDQGSCDLVAGNIRLADVCDRWEKK